jgi:hypothetical protein
MPLGIIELAQLGGHLYAQASPRDLLALTAIALVTLAVALLADRVGVTITAGPLRGRGVALRDKARAARFQRQLDPDAAGRPRPRAPSAAPAAA